MSSSPSVIELNSNPDASPTESETKDEQEAEDSTRRFNISEYRAEEGETILEFQVLCYSQREELSIVKRQCELLRAALSKSQEEKRSMELQLVSEKGQREQQLQNNTSENEKKNIQTNAQIYTMKCDVETWKRKAEGTNMELNLLKEQLKNVEFEKGEAMRKLQALTGYSINFEQFKSSFEIHTMRTKEALQLVQKQMAQVQCAEESLTIVMEANQKDVNVMNVHIKSLEENRSRAESRITELEQDLIKARTELALTAVKLEKALAVEADNPRPGVSKEFETKSNFFPN